MRGFLKYAGIACAFMLIGVLAADAAYFTNVLVKVRKYLTVGTSVKNSAMVTVKSNGTDVIFSGQNSSGTEVFSISAAGALAPASISTSGAMTADSYGSDGETADPCPTVGVGKLFYNSTSNYWCFCDGSTDDLKITDNTTACF